MTGSGCPSAASAATTHVFRQNVYQDEWGTTYQKDAASWPIDAPIDYPIRSRADLSGYRPPDPTLPGRDTEIRAAGNANASDLALLGGVQGPRPPRGC